MFSRVTSEAVRTARAVGTKAAAATVAVATAAAGGGTMAFSSDDEIHTPTYNWPHNGVFSSHDHAAIRRGFQVYREVCSTCHSIQLIAFRNLVDVAHTKLEMKKMAAEYEVEDGPNEEGEMFERPAKLSDRIPGPYKNDKAARAANNGSYPPDLSLMTKARHNGVDYVMSLLTGYTDPPVGKDMMEGLHYNAYFTGAAIAMPPPLMDGQVEYADGTPATVSQMARDVSTFLAWCAEPEHDERKLMGMKWCTLMAVSVAISLYYKRFRWAPIKTRKISYVD